MSGKSIFALLVLLSALALPGLPASAGAQQSATFVGHYTTGSLSAQEQSAGNLVNSDRSAYSLPTLTIDPELSRIARLKSQDMARNKYFAHLSPTYGDVRQMLKAQGYAYAAAGENIAHHATVEKCQAALLSSPGHRRNLLTRTYTKLGVGIALDEKGYVYLTQIFVR